MAELFKSKKSIVGLILIACLTAVAIVSAITGSNYITGDAYIAGLSAIGGTYLISQGIADQGKEAAKLNGGK